MPLCPLHYLLLIIFLVGGVLGGCDTAEVVAPEPEAGFSAFGLNGIAIEQLHLAGETLFAATEQGMYSRSIDESSSWQLIGLDGLHVVAFTPQSGNDLLASVDVGGASEPLFYRGSNGTEWEALESDYGGEVGATQASALASHPEGRDTVFARGAMNVAKSTDGGETWRSVFQDWDAAGYQAPLLYFDPRDPSRIWAGGETAIFQPYVLRSSDFGETWAMLAPDADGDNAVYSMAIHPQSGEILIGMEGRVMVSTDDGETWITRFEPESAAYLLDMDVLEQGSGRTIYAAGSEGGAAGGRIAVYRSDDFGESWARFEYPDGPQQTATRSLVASTDGNQTVLYLGTGHGVFRYVE